MSALEDRRVRLRVGKAAAYRRRRLAVVGLVVTLLLAITGFGLYRFWNKPLSTTLPAPVTVDAKQFTMLVMGADDRPGEPGRSDTMMVGFVDLDQGSVKLLSIPRDSYVQIPGHGWDKINAAYPFGGAALVQQTVEQLIGMKLNYTISVNMQGFEQIVDAVGGVDINIPQDMDYEDPYDKPVPLVIHLKQGLQHLNGVDTLHYVRFRHDAESDWGRMKRQQQFLQALTQAALKPANLTRLPELVKLGSQNVTTNLSPKQLSQLAMLGKDKLGADKISGGTLQGDDIWATDGGYYLGLHFAEMRAKVRELAGITPDQTQLSQDDKDAQTYVAGLPSGSSLPGGETTDSSAGSGSASGGSSGSGSASGGSSGSGSASGGSSGTGGGGTQGGGSGSKPDPSPTPPPGSSNSGSGGSGTGGTGPAPGGSGSGGTSPAPGGTGSGGTSPAPGGSGSGGTPGAGSGGSSTPPPTPDPKPTPPPTPTPPPVPGKTGGGKTGPGTGTGTGSGTGGTTAKPGTSGVSSGGTSATAPGHGTGATAPGHGTGATAPGHGTGSTTTGT